MTGRGERAKGAKRDIGPRAVAALGGNALLRRIGPLEDANQAHAARGAAPTLAEAAWTHRIPITHGNGPQVGLLKLPEGSLGPKVEAVCHFVEATGRAAIGSLQQVPLLLGGRAGTRVLAQVPKQAKAGRRHASLA